ARVRLTGREPDLLANVREVHLDTGTCRGQFYLDEFDQVPGLCESPRKRNAPITSCKDCCDNGGFNELSDCPTSDGQEIAENKPTGICEEFNGPVLATSLLCDSRRTKPRRSAKTLTPMRRSPLCLATRAKRTHGDLRRLSGSCELW